MNIVQGTGRSLERPVSHTKPYPQGGITILVMSFVAAAIGLTMLRSWRLRRLRPVLAGLPPTEERITPADVQQAVKANAGAATGKQLLALGSIGIFAVIAFIFNFIVQVTVTHGSTLLALMSIVGAIFFSLTAATAFMRLHSRSKKRA
jgi:drug/metabolite transporter (DMT)-like permease